MRLEFRLLGPVELRLDGMSVALGPVKRTTLATALILEANRAVPLPRLLAALWPGPPPRSAVANVRSHVSALRRVLGGRLRTLPEAYLLTVDDAELDAARFIRLSRAGREALAAGKVTSAVTGLGAALALWRGAAGEGVSRGSWLGDLLTAFEGQRLDVFEDYVEARLQAGDHDELVADLRRHISTDPLRERPWGQLMRALHCVGRAAEALDAYGELQRTLREQLGVEPNDELRQIHRAILNRDATLASGARPWHRTIAVLDQPTDAGPVRRPAARPGTVHAPPPRTLPVAAHELVGRDDLVTQVAGAVLATVGTARSVVICGRAGVGKSALALAVAHRLAPEFPDGQVYLDLSRTFPGHIPSQHADLLAGILIGLGVGPLEVPPTVVERHALIRGYATQRRLLLVVDNVRRTADLELLMSAATGITTLVTARRRLATSHPVEHRLLPGLSVDDGVELLARQVGGGRVAAEAASAAAVALMCDGLPTALHLVSARLASRPTMTLSTLATMLALDPLDVLQFSDVSLRQHFADHYRAAAAEDQLAGRVFPLLGLPTAEATATVGDIVYQISEAPGRVFRTLEYLVDVHLVETPEAGRYRAPGLLRRYAAELAADPGRAIDGSAILAA